MGSGRRRKYGTADKWMTVGLAFLALGAGAFGGSFAAGGLFADFELAFRLGGIVAGAIGLLIALWGVRVWRYNLKHDELPTALVVGTVSPEEDRWAELTKRRDELDVELAGLQPHVFSGGVPVLSLFASTSPEDIEKRAALARANKRREQVEAELRAIQVELREMIQGQGG